MQPVARYLPAWPNRNRRALHGESSEWSSTLLRLSMLKLYRRGEQRQSPAQNEHERRPMETSPTEKSSCGDGPAVTSQLHSIAGARARNAREWLTVRKRL